MSKNHKRVTTQQRIQRRAASVRAQERRKSLKIISLLEGLKESVIALDKLNCPPVRYPTGNSSSVIQVGTARSNDGDEDPQINRFLATLELDLILRNDEAYKLRRKS